MKAMTKKQLAACAGISVKTLTKWLAPHKAELARMGYPVGRRCIPPSVVGWIAKKFCIDLECAPHKNEQSNQ